MNKRRTVTDVPYWDIKEKLKTRNADYGDYYEGIAARSTIMNVLEGVHKKHKGNMFTQTQREAMHDVINKLVRLAATPGHQDSWLDVMGYANCILNDLEKLEEGQ